MDDRLRRELRFLRAYVLISTIALGGLTISAFRQQKQRFTEIDVERINVVEPNGNLRMVISNRERSIGPIYKGKPFGYPGGTRPGIIFFNDEGTENGGLTFTGRRLPDGRVQAGTHMSFDQFDQDQVVVLSFNENGPQRRLGLSFSDRAPVNIFDMVAERDSIMKQYPAAGPARDSALARWAQPRNGVPLVAERVYVGRTANKASLINLSDPSGRSRIRMMVDSLGNPSLEFLDAQGRVVAKLPEAPR